MLHKLSLSFVFVTCALLIKSFISSCVLLVRGLISYLPININLFAVPLIKIRGVTDKPVKVDWVPPNASTELVNNFYIIFY